jgi:hypothetical protein
LLDKNFLLSIIQQKENEEETPGREPKAPDPESSHRGLCRKGFQMELCCRKDHLLEPNFGKTVSIHFSSNFSSHPLTLFQAIVQK